jgi:hypothetical protein
VWIKDVCSKFVSEIRLKIFKTVRIRKSSSWCGFYMWNLYGAKIVNIRLLRWKAERRKRRKKEKVERYNIEVVLTPHHQDSNQKLPGFALHFWISYNNIIYNIINDGGSIDFNSAACLPSILSFQSPVLPVEISADAFFTYPEGEFVQVNTIQAFLPSIYYIPVMNLFYYY